MTVAKVKTLKYINGILTNKFLINKYQWTKLCVDLIGPTMSVDKKGQYI